jgi:hypothetical protein
MIILLYKVLTIFIVQYKNKQRVPSFVHATLNIYLGNENAQTNLS